MLALLFLLMPNRTDYHDLHGISVDLTETHYAIPMPGAVREDAIRISITRDGKVYFRNHQVALDDLPDEIREGLRNGAERKIYLAVDARARYGDIPHILNEIRHSGVEKVSFLTWQRP